MDLREKISDAVYDHPGAPAIIDAVMGVVEGDAAKRRAYTERRVEMARKAEAAKWETRVRELEDENQRMRENVRLKNRAAYLSAINACMARLQGQTDIKAVFPALHEMRDRAVELHNAALSRARQIAEEEAHAGSCSHVASGLLLDGSTCARPIGHTGDHSDHKGGMWENTKEGA